MWPLTTMLKAIAILAVMVAAPMLWLDLVEAMLHPEGGGAPLFVSAEYLVAYALTIVSLAIVPFLRSAPLRALFSLAMISAIAFDQAVQALSGAHVNQELVNLLWQERANAADGLSFLPQVAGSIAWLALIAVIYLLPPRRWSLSKRFALIPVAALAITFHNVRIGNYQKVTQPPVFAIEGQIAKAMVMSDRRTDPPAEIAYSGSVAPKIRNILFIVDESVGGKFISLNNDQFDDTPFLSGLPDKDFFFNYGEASSIANCSSASRLMLRVGLKRSRLPDRSHASLHAPNFWMYAHRAGFRSVYFDAFRSSLTYHSYMGAKEAAQIDERIALGGAGNLQTMDHDIAHRLLRVLDEPGRHFIFVEKKGTHYPHDGRVVPDDYAYEPKGVREYGDALDLNPDQRGQVRNYLKEIRWQVDEFFRILKPALDRPDTVVIYTSDHGQNMFQSRSKLFHCSDRDVSISEGSVPLVVATGNRRLAAEFAQTAGRRFNRSSHFEIFPTLLDLMGYDQQFVRSHYGPALVGALPVAPRKFLLRFPFKGHWRHFDENLIDNDDDLLGAGWGSWPKKISTVAKNVVDPAVPPYCSYVVALGAKANLAVVLSHPVASGTTLAAGIWLWADHPLDLTLALARQGKAKWESSSKIVRVGPVPSNIEISHTFEADQSAARLQITNQGDKKVVFKACEATMVSSRNAVPPE